MECVPDEGRDDAEAIPVREPVGTVRFDLNEYGKGYVGANDDALVDDHIAMSTVDSYERDVLAAYWNGVRHGIEMERQRRRWWTRLWPWRKPLSWNGGDE
jgi:hypothetical protein